MKYSYGIARELFERLLRKKRWSLPLSTKLVWVVVRVGGTVGQGRVFVGIAAPAIIPTLLAWVLEDGADPLGEGVGALLVRPSSVLLWLLLTLRLLKAVLRVGVRRRRLVVGLLLVAWRKRWGRCTATEDVRFNLVQAVRFGRFELLDMIQHALDLLSGTPVHPQRSRQFGKCRLDHSKETIHFVAGAFVETVVVTFVATWTLAFSLDLGWRVAGFDAWVVVPLVAV